MIIGDKIETETKTLQQERNACDISIAIIACSLWDNDWCRIMKEKWYESESMIFIGWLIIVVVFGLSNL